MAARTIVGLDIGATHIKVVVLSHASTPPKLISYGKVAAPSPGMMSEAELDLTAVAESVKSLIGQIKSPTKDVVISLPESQIFSRVIYDFPYLSNEELNQAIRYAAEEFVPMPIQDVNLNFQVLYRSAQKGPQSRTVVFVVASPKALVNKYLKVLSMANLKPLAIETELIASSRSLITYSDFSPTTLLIQFNTYTTNFAVVSEGVILLTRSISAGALALTRAIAQSFNLELIQAEEYKKVYGLRPDQLEGKMVNILKPIIDIIMAEGRKVIQTHKTQNPEKVIKRVILSGGGAQLPGLTNYLATGFDLEVQEGNPWNSVTKDPSLQAKLINDAASFALPVGLALWS